MLACSGSLHWRGSNGMSGLQSNGMSGLQSDTSLNNLIEEISALTLNSGAWSGVRGLRASESRVRRGGRRDIRMGAMGGAELYASRSNCLSNFSMKTNLLLVDLAMRSVAILGLSVAILRLFVAIMRLSVAMIRRSILSRVKACDKNAEVSIKQKRKRWH